MGCMGSKDGNRLGEPNDVEQYLAQESIKALTSYKVLLLGKLI